MNGNISVLMVSMMIFLSFGDIVSVREDLPEGEGYIGPTYSSSFIFGDSYYNDTTAYIESNISVESGERLVFNNSTVMFNCSYDGAITIHVKIGGSILINHSFLTINRTGDFSNNHGFNYLIRVDYGGSISIQDSNMSYAGFADGDSSGISTRCDDPKFVNTTFFRCYNGLFINSDDDYIDRVLVDNCTFTNLERNGIQFTGSKDFFYTKIINSTFFNINDSAIKFGTYEHHGYPSNQYFLFDNNIMINCNYGIYKMDIYNGGRISDSMFINCSLLSIMSYSTLEKITIKQNIFKNSEMGINISSIYYSNICNNIFNKCTKSIFIDHSPYGISNNIINNSINNSKIGIDIFAANFMVSNNTINNCSKYGINLNNREHFYAFKNNKIVNNILDNNSIAIHFKTTDDDLIENNTITNSNYGIYSDNSIILNIRNNNITGCQHSIRALNGNRLKLSNNYLSGTGKGVWMSSCESVNLSSNYIENHQIGLTMDDSNGVTVIMNTFEDHENGIIVDSRTRNLVVSKNSFLDNDIHAFDDGGHQWDLNGYGNYWAGLPDYHDWDGDGIVDEPVHIDENSIDNFPLIVPWGQPWNRKIELGFITGERWVEATKWCNFTFTATDPDDDLPLFELEWDRDILFNFNNQTGSFSYPSIEKDVGRIEFTVTVFDQNGTRDNGSFAINVIAENFPPIVQPIDPIRAYPGELIITKLNSSDPNGDRVTIRVNETDTPFQLNINQDGYLTFRAKEEHTGVFHASLKFSDNNGSYTFLAIEIEILPFNIPPNVPTIQDLIAFIGETFEYQVHVIDPNPDIISFSINYTGDSDHSIDHAGLIRIIPVAIDAGDQTVSIIVSDNNGSIVAVEFQLRVKYRNAPPTGPSSFGMLVHAGDIYQQIIPVSDPDGDHLTVHVQNDLPDWLHINDILLFTLTPTLKEIGVHVFDLNISDGKGGYLDLHLEIEIVAGKAPSLLISDSIEMFEREITTVFLETDYNGNGSLTFGLDDDVDWITLNGNELMISPNDGDHGSYSINILVSILGGTSTTCEIAIDVDMNLTTLECLIVLDPQREQYDVGDQISFEITFSGYDAELQFILIVLKDGFEIDRIDGNKGRLEFNDSGLYELKLEIEGYGPMAKMISFQVNNDSDGKTGISPAIIIILMILILIIFAVFLLVYLQIRKKKKDSMGDMRIDNNSLENTGMGLKEEPLDQTDGTTDSVVKI